MPVLVSSRRISCLSVNCVADYTESALTPRPLKAIPQIENGPADFPARPLSSKPPTYPLELVRASRPRSIPLPWRVASFPKGNTGY